MESFFRENGGAVLSTTFDKYCYVNVRHLPRFFDYSTELSYSKTERVTNIDDIQHPAIRNAMKMLDMHEIRLTYEADLPARSGLGTSSSFAVGMLNAFYALKGKYADKKKLADEAIYLERNLCQEAGGWQDQIAASFGGFNRINFNADGYEVLPVIISPERKKQLNQNLMMFFTGFTRFSSDVQKANAAGKQDKTAQLKEMLALVDDAERVLTDKNAGLHVIDPKVLDMVSIDADKIGTVDKTTGKTVKVDLDRQLLKPLAGTGKMFCYDSPEYVKDMGTPDRFHQVEEDFKAGRVAAKNLSNKQKAVFLDRDGTINKYVGFLRNINEFELINGVAEAIKKINASGYLAIVVTNQPVIARGEVTFQELEEIHNKMETELGLQGAYLDAIYYCPHHPHKGYEGEVPELKIECDCRKPKPGMLLKAATDYNIDLSQSYMIGDGENDIKAGLAARCKAILVNGTGTDAKSEDFGQADTLASVLEFVDKYLC